MTVASAAAIAQYRSSTHGSSRGYTKEEAVTHRALANELWLELYAQRGSGWLPVLTDSMAPLIRPGDRVLVRRMDAEGISFGDIAVFRRNDDLIVHRLFKKRRKGNSLVFSEKGDVEIALKPLNGNDIIGMVTVVRRRGMSFVLSSPLSRLASVGLSAWLYGTAAGAARLRSSRIRTVRRAGRFLSWSVILTSNVLIRICFAVWYPAGLVATKKVGPC